MISIQNLTYSYPRSEVLALSGITLQAEAGEFIGIIGANGSGKSTLCYSMSGFIPHFYKGKLEGKLEVAGHEIPATPLGSLTADIGLVFQNPFNQMTGARYTVREEIAFGLENLGVPREEMAGRVDQVLVNSGMGDLADRSPFELSGGQQQRLAIASIIVMGPRVLVLDEPTSQLDSRGTQEVFTTLESLVDKGGTTVVLATHKLEWLANFADRVAVLSQGKLLAYGATQQVLTDPNMDAWGVVLTRYTRAALMAHEQRLTRPGGELPVTLTQAVRYFHGIIG